MQSSGKYIRISLEDLKKAVWSPELEEVFKSTGSSIVLEEDNSSVQIRLVCRGVTWFRYRLRDRKFDGPGWIATPLIDWRYDGKRDVFFWMGGAVEESIYCLDPRSSLLDLFTPDIADFITNPFEALPYDSPDREKLQSWADKCNFVLKSEHILYPGYFFAKNITGVRKNILDNVLTLLVSNNYRYLTAVPTWWHINSMYERLNFKHMFGDDEFKIRQMQKLLAVKEDGSERSRVKSSWIVMLQFWAELVVKSGMDPEDFGVSPEHILRDDNGTILTFPLTPDKNLWLRRRA